MNYYYPYMNMYPYMNNIAKPGIFSGLIKGIKSINFSSILSGTQKTLNVVNQTIPLVKQVSPIVKNAKTMFKVMNEFKKTDKPTNNNVINNKEEKKETITNNNYNQGPTFFM